MRLYEWIVATEVDGALRQSPVGITSEWPRAETRMLDALSSVPGEVSARGWVTVLALGSDRTTYDRLETPVQVVREADGSMRTVPGDGVGDRLRGRLEAQPWTTPINSQRLRELRLRHGLSQERLADAAGISLTTVARLERHPLPLCHFRTRWRLASALGEHPYAITAAISPELAKASADAS